ncbi:MAG: hypothetical protein CMJ75_19115 [Planctomycetaceae bacterium]|nr:hypothetical protein [Planctomycetaceae bacterium]
MALSKEDLELMTDEERAGYEEDLNEETGGEEETDGEHDGETDGENDGNDEGADGENEDDGSDDGSDDEGADQGGDDGQDAGDDTGGDDAGDDEGGEPLPQAPVIEGVEEKLAGFETTRTELERQYDEGELTTTEYMKQLRAVDKEEDALNWQVREAELESRRLNDVVNTKWYTNVETFLGEHTEIQRSKLTMNAFDQIVREETAKTIEKGYQPGERDLQRAYTRWREELGYEQAPAPPKPKKDDPAPKRDAAKPQRRPLPPSLAKVPAADMNDTDDGEFAHLDRLADTDPLGFEAELAKMHDAVRDRYMQS